MGEGRISGPFFAYATRGPAPVKGEARPPGRAESRKKFRGRGPGIFFAALDGERGAWHGETSRESRRPKRTAQGPKAGPGGRGTGGATTTPPPLSGYALCESDSLAQGAKGKRGSLAQSPKKTLDREGRGVVS